MFVPMRFATLSHDGTGTPVAVLQETSGNRELKVAVSGNDASKIAILNFGVLKEVAKDLSLELIDGFGAEVAELRVSSEREHVIRCDLFLKAEGRVFQVTPRPGEAIIIAIQKQCPIMVAEELFYSDRKLPSLKDKIRSRDVIDFGTSHLL